MKYLERLVNLKSVYSLFCLLLVLAVSGVLQPIDSLSAEDKKKKKDNGEMDSTADKQAYMRELLKGWSFGYENYKNKQYKDAIKWLWKVAELDTMNKFGSRTYRYLGDSYFNLQKPDTARMVYEEGVEKYPDDSFLHRMVGYFLVQTEQNEEAIPKYEKVVELEPESIADLKQLASLYVKTDRFEEAVDVYDKIIALDPNDIAVQRDQAQILQMIDPEAALEKKAELATREPDNSQVRFELGKIYFDRGEYEESLKYYGEFLVLVPNDIAAMEYVGTANVRLERLDEAITEYKKIMDIDPKNKKVLTDISRCYKELNNFSAARTYALKATSLDANFGLGWIALGEAYEACADHCIDKKDGKVDYDDKLVYRLAYAQYQKALKDLQYRSDAERRISFVKAVLPTTEDEFMHKDQDKAQGPCYSWIY